MMRTHGVMAFGVGLVLILAGMFWGSFVAGVPYPDPTPAQQADYQMHMAITERLLLVGGFMSFVLAPLLRVFRRWQQRKDNTQ